MNSLNRATKLINAIKSEEKALELKEYNGPDRVVSSLEMKDICSDRIKRIRVDINSGFRSLDSLLYGFRGGELTVISGITKHGKTLFLQSMTKNMAEFGHKALWFTFEVPNHQFIDQFGVDLPTFFMPVELKGNSIDWIEDRMVEGIQKYGIEAVCIDHLHYVVDMAFKSNMSLEIGRCMRLLKRLAVDYDVAMFLIAHTQKIKVSEELDTDSLRDSSFVAQEADNVLFVMRSDKYPGKSIVKVAANRRLGVMGNKVMLEKRGKFLVDPDGD